LPQEELDPGKPMVRVIINADDFGLSQSVNEGIVKAHREGILTSATLMANTPGFEQAAALAAENPRLGVGLHLNVVRGFPVSKPESVPSLLTPEGRFPASAGKVIRGLYSRRLKAEDLERELRAQVEKALQAGVRLSHFDSEKNLHVIPPFFRAVLRLGREFGIKKVRFVREFRLSGAAGQSLKAAFLSAVCLRMRRRALGAGFVITDRFYGICNSGRMTAQALTSLLSRQKDGSAEIMVHPGYVRQDLLDLEPVVGRYYINRSRELELGALLDPGPKEAVRERAIRLINFHEL
jgi:hopanoid biosynthesis associated protein HpnK